MLTLLDAISLAGDRAKQNDDAFGLRAPRAWVIDGATDLHDAPVSPAASDAAWIAQRANAFLHAHDGDLRTLVRAASIDAREAFAAASDLERWKLPTASLLMIAETGAGVDGLDLGDSRCFAQGAAGESFAFGGAPASVDREAKAAADAAEKAGDTPVLAHDETRALLRRGRARHNEPGHYAVFGLQPVCADRARAWRMPLTRPAHILLCTDGFSALADRYGAFAPDALVRAAAADGLAALAQRLRAIEAEDATGARHPRFKPSDDATAVLLRLT